MRIFLIPVFILLTFTAGCINQAVEEERLPETGPIRLHPENPHYFLYNNKPVALITSGEHYGAVLNLDFDYKTYLKRLSSDGMNYTRIFTGTYFEIPGESFGIRHNSLAPEKGRVITPWAFVVPDLSGNIKYDLGTWNDAYFERLKDFLQNAATLDIIVEITLFSSIYRDDHWDICPQNPSNNINITHEINRREANTLNNGTLFQFQEKLVRKLVVELNDFDNFFFEIQNEPWADRPVPVFNIVNKEDLNPLDWTYKADFGDKAALDWQDSLASIITDEESRLDKIHLIAQNYTNFLAPIPEVKQNISIINFHYAWPEAVEWNYHYNKVIGFDESGFAGSSDDVYRRQAWKFIMSGGGLFNSLDYSFYPGHEDGKGDNQAPGGGSVNLRRQLNILQDFIQGFDLVKLNPDHHSVIRSPGLITYVLSNTDREYAVFLRAVGTSNTTLEIETGEGTFTVERLNTITGSVSDAEIIEAQNELLAIDLNIPDGEMALKILKE